jgi:tRNA A-37 threonylcarbamoyl transferase component Bud32
MDEIWTKTSSADNKWTFYTQEQAFWTEIACLSRLKSKKNFPVLHSYDPKNYLITMDNRGYPVRYHVKHQIKVSIPDVELQIDNIVHSLERNNIVYLDMHPSGKNVCVDNGIISLIDFDYAVVDGNLFNENVKQLYEYWMENVGYTGLKILLREIVDQIL